MKPLLVGECNPLSDDPRLALWPDPPGCAGWRLCHRVFGMDTHAYLRTFARVNLCVQEWDLATARGKAEELHKWDGPLLLLGSKVCQAFRVPYAPFSVQMSLLGKSRSTYTLPHPSGRCFAWNDPSNTEKARKLLEEVLS